MSTALVAPSHHTGLAPAGPNPLIPWLGNYPSERTREAYRHDATLWADWCAANGVDLLNPRPGHITDWTEHLRTTPNARGRPDSESSIARRVSSVLAFYKWARHEELTKADPTPFRRVKVQRDAAVNLGLTAEQLGTVCQCAGGARNLAFVMLLGRCGLRVSEALDADIDTIRDQSGHRVIHVIGKGNRPRTVPLPPTVVHFLADYLDGRDVGPLFITRTGKRWVRRDAWAAVEAIGRRAGIPNLHPHIFRHTACTLMLDSGAPLDRVQYVMGHADPKTTLGYARARDQLNHSPVYDLDRYLAARIAS
jgi:site-specific recombinase XerD